MFPRGGSIRLARRAAQQVLPRRLRFTGFRCATIPGDVACRWCGRWPDLGVMRVLGYDAIDQQINQSLVNITVVV